MEQYQQDTSNQNINNFQQKPDSHLAWAILSTLCCCLPFGIVAIVYSSKVDGYYMAGMTREAQLASYNARKWALAATIVGAAVIFIYLMIYAFIIIFAISRS